MSLLLEPPQPTPPPPASESMVKLQASHSTSCRRQQSEAEAGARQEALERMDELRGEMLRALEILHAVQALFEVKPEVTRTEFSRFVQSALVRLPELQALEWIPRVSHAERARYESAARADGLADFHFTEIDPEGRIVPAGERDEYLPVLYVEPPLSNFPVLGLDLRADARRREALEQAALTGKPTATSPLPLAQITGDRMGFLVVLAVSAPGGGEVAGFCLAVFRVERLVRQVFAPLVGRGVRLEIRDLSDRSAPVYAAGESGTEAPAWSLEQEMPIVGRVWQFTFAPTPAFRAADPDWLRRAAETLLRTNEVLEERVAERTAQLAELNVALQKEIKERTHAESVAESANRAKSLFLAEMSHEIRTPLNAILGYAQLMQRDTALAGGQAGAVRSIVEGSNHLLCLVDGVLDLTKIETGRMEQVPVDFDLSMLVNGLAAMFGPRCQQKGLRFRVEALGDRPAWVRGDERKLRQVLVNLLGNAVKFTDHGELRLRVTPVGGRGSYRFEVIDTGAGIVEDAQRTIFEPFHQEAEGRAKGGTGLGLSIARRLIELLGGSLAVNSVTGWGSNFFFALAFEPSRVAASPRASSPFARIRLAPGVRVRALVVDDHPMNRDVLVRMLTALGCETESADCGAAALALAEANLPDVVFMDVCMPGMSGMTAARALRQFQSGRNLRLVAYSALAFEHERDEISAAGFDECLPKPFRFERIVECLARLEWVSFVQEETGPLSESACDPPLDHARVRLPDACVARLRAATEIGDFAVLRTQLDEIERSGGEEAILARQMRAWAERFDTDAILMLLAALPASHPPAV